MDHCLACGKPFGFDRVTVGMLWWAKSYCSQICADEDEKKIQQEERKKEHQSWLWSRPP